jgi:acyl carrier protein
LIDTTADQTPESNDGGVDIVGCGRSEIEADIRIVDPVTLAECPADQIGEIWVCSASVAQGYWNRPEATAETFGGYLAGSGTGPFMRTGDLGFQWQDELFVTGRIKDLLIIRGRNLYPQDIEVAVEQAHPALQTDCCAAISMTHNGVESLVVMQEIKRTFLRDFDLDETVTAIRRTISKHFDVQPHAILLLRPSSILKTSSGKIQRQGNKKAYLAYLKNKLSDELFIIGQWQAPDLPSNASVKNLDDSVPTQTQIANWITMWLAQKLNAPITTILPTVPFVDFGLDSVAAVELTQDLEDWLPNSLNIDLESTLIWSHPTISAVATFIIETAIGPVVVNDANQPNTNIKDEELDTLSEAELAALLAEEIKSFRL